MIAFLLSPIGKIVGAIGFVILIVISFNLWLSAHDKAMLSGYVLASEKAAATAKANEMERQAKAATDALAKANARTVEAIKAKAQTSAELDREIADYEKRLANAKRDCLFDDGDVDAIMRHR